MTRAHNTYCTRRYPPLDSVRGNALEMINVIKNDEKAAEYFFFVEMFSKMNAIAKGYNKSFGTDLTAADVSCVTYLCCWENNWARLSTYKGETSPHNWMARIATQATYSYLVEEHYIYPVCDTRTQDYRLKVRGINNTDLRQAIVDLVYVPELHHALEMYYVKKLPVADMAKSFGNQPTADKILKTAEKTLIEQLLNTENPYAEIALSTKRPLNPELRWQVWHDRIDDDEVTDSCQLLRELLSPSPEQIDWDENAHNFILAIITQLEWCERDRDLWYERFFNNTPSARLAERYAVRNTWIDNRYSILNKEFRIAVRTWWNLNAS